MQDHLGCGNPTSTGTSNSLKSSCWEPNRHQADVNAARTHTDALLFQTAHTLWTLFCQYVLLGGVALFAP
jgi:hypothetical protein